MAVNLKTRSGNVIVIFGIPDHNGKSLVYHAVIVVANDQVLPIIVGLGLALAYTTVWLCSIRSVLGF
jgi:hypothetical protein